MLKRTGKLKARKPLNRLSERKIRQLNSEVTARILLCKRAGGLPIQQSRMVKLNNGRQVEVSTITCISGYCECGCGEYSPILHPHEEHSRGRGGKLSLQNSKMVKDNHHDILQNNLPKWSKGEK